MWDNRSTMLDESLVRDVVRRALEEDIGGGDLTSEAVLDPRAQAKGVLVAREAIVVCGLGIARESFRQAGPRLTRCAAPRVRSWRPSAPP